MAIQAVLAGAAAGAAGTTALDAVTFLDMVVRGRPASSTPQTTVEEIADKTHVPIPGDEDERSNRTSALGSLSGIAAGVSTGIAVGLATDWIRNRGQSLPVAVTGVAAALGAMLGGNGPMTLLGVTDPRKWSTTDWLSDVVPHVAYGLVTAWTLDRVNRSRQPHRTAARRLLSRVS